MADSNGANGPTAAPLSAMAQLRRFLLFLGLSFLLVIALVAVDILALGLNTPARAFSPHYYMALGDSISFGYQPNFNFDSGFADDIFNDLHSGPRGAQVTNVENLACAGETTQTMIQGGCVARFAHKGSYVGAQLTAALDFLKAAKNKGRVSPVTLEIGVNDAGNDLDLATCSEKPSAATDLARMDSDLTQTILPELIQALTMSSGALAGDLAMLNYYNPYVKVCPDSVAFVHMLNDHLLADAAQFKIPVVDVYNAFGGDTGMAGNICTLTWYCSAEHDIHPTALGYRTIADAVEKTLGLPGSSLLPGIGVPASAPTAAPVLGAPAGDLAPRSADVWRLPAPPDVRA